jgi:hypothetical protein
MVAHSANTRGGVADWGSVTMVKMGTVWDRTAEFLTDNLTAIVPIALLAFFVPFSIQGNFAHIRDGANPGFALTLQLVSLAFGLLAMWGWLTIVAMTLGGGEERNASSIATRKLLPALLIWVLLFLALFGIPIAAVLALAPGSEDAVRGSASMIEMIRTGLVVYILVVLLPLVALLGRLVLITPVIVGEGKLFGAIGRSFRLTRGLTLGIFGVLLLYALVSNVAVLATQTVFGSIFELLAGAPASALSLSVVLTSVMVAAVQTGFTVIGPVFTANLYMALTQREAAATA